MKNAALRRFEILPNARPNLIRPLPPQHSAVMRGHTVFKSTVVDADKSPRLFVSGFNNRKIGKKVQKGEWAGMPIYMLTLEERATCPSACSNWSTCYGNAMHMARRHRHGPALEYRVQTEIVQLARTNPKGFVVRLHVLGDFYSVEYVQIWAGLLSRYKELHVFGYTARDGCSIGDEIQEMNERFPSRCFIRTSTKTPRAGGASVVTSPTAIEGAIICPAELSKTECCSTCGICWSPAARDKAILFILHGNPRRWPNKKKEGGKVMSESDWIELSPWNLKKSDEPRVSIRAACMGKHKVPIAYIGLNSQLCKLANIDRNGKALAKIDFGTGANDGMLRVQQSSKGRFKFAVSGTKGDTNGVRLVLRVPNQPPAQSRQQILDHKIIDGAIIISLPTEWANVVAVKPFSHDLVDSTAKPVNPNKEVLAKIEARKEIGTSANKISTLPAKLPPKEITQKTTIVSVKPEILEMIKKEEAKTNPEIIQETVDSPQLPCVKMQLAGRYLVIGQTPVNLFADEVILARALIGRFGETLTAKEADKLEEKPSIAIKRLQGRLAGMKIVIEDRAQGWAMANGVQQ